jgi:hypothetical protein
LWYGAQWIFGDIARVVAARVSLRLRCLLIPLNPACLIEATHAAAYSAKGFVIKSMPGQTL